LSEFVLSLVVEPACLSRRQLIERAEELRILQSVESIETLRSLALLENPVPVMVICWPADEPLLGVKVETEGKTVNW